MRSKILTLGCGVLFLGACTKAEPPELILLTGACEVVVKTDTKHSDIFVDGILIGHGEASTKVPCGQKRIVVEAPGKWVVEDYKNVDTRVPLEVTYKLADSSHVKDWALSPELVDQLRKGHGPVDIRNPKYKEVLAAQEKQRAEQGFYYTTAELAAATKKAMGQDEAAATAAPTFDPNTNFDDPNTWM